MNREIPESKVNDTDDGDGDGGAAAWTGTEEKAT